MKIGWLVWEYEDDEFPTLVPDGDGRLGYCHKKVQIVYAEVIED